jgi:hypothetical protein
MSAHRHVPKALIPTPAAPEVVRYAIGYDTGGMIDGPFGTLAEALEEIGNVGLCIWRVGDQQVCDRILYRWHDGGWERPALK